MCGCQGRGRLGASGVSGCGVHAGGVGGRGQRLRGACAVRRSHDACPEAPHRHHIGDAGAALHAGLARTRAPARQPGAGGTTAAYPRLDARERCDSHIVVVFSGAGMILPALSPHSLELPRYHNGHSAISPQVRGILLGSHRWHLPRSASGPMTMPACMNFRSGVAPIVSPPSTPRSVCGKWGGRSRRERATPRHSPLCMSLSPLMPHYLSLSLS